MISVNMDFALIVGMRQSTNNPSADMCEKVWIKLFFIYVFLYLVNWIEKNVFYLGLDTLGVVCRCFCTEQTFIEVRW